MDFTAAFLALAPIALGCLSSWHGGQIHGGDPKWLKNTAWCIPFALTALACLPLWTLLFMPLCALKSTGHGRVWEPRKPLDASKEPEAVEKYITGWLYGRISDFWYKTLTMAIIGFAAVSGAALAFAITSPLSGLCIAVGGLCKGLNAVIFGKNTAIREYADGCAAGCGLIAGVILL